jgi:hypothetical protein
MALRVRERIRIGRIGACAAVAMLASMTATASPPHPSATPAKPSLEPPLEPPLWEIDVGLSAGPIFGDNAYRQYDDVVSMVSWRQTIGADVSARGRTGDHSSLGGRIALMSYGGFLGVEGRAYPVTARTFWLGALAGGGGMAVSRDGATAPFLLAPALGAALGAAGARRAEAGAAWELRYTLLPYRYQGIPSLGRSVPSGPQHIVTFGLALRLRDPP